MLTAETVAGIVAKHGAHAKDTGRSEVQIALLTANINALQQHFQEHGKDHHSRYGLLKMISKRRKLLDYLKGHNLQRYRTILAELSLRR